jgi:hypothetical protein
MCRIANRVLSENDRSLQELAETSSGRSETEPWLGRPLGSSEMTNDNDARASIAKPSNGGQRRSNAAIVSDVRAVERYVEVTTNEDVLATKIAE